MARRTILQAGGVVVRAGDAGPEVLLVTARRHRRRWVFPKGTVEEDETPAAAALREAEEEAGAIGSVMAPAGTVTFRSGRWRVRVEYFIIALERHDPERGEDRAMRWCTFDEAAELLHFPGTRRILAETHALLPSPDRLSVIAPNP